MLELLLTDIHTTNDDVYVHFIYIHMYTRLLKRRLKQLDKILPISMDDSCPVCPKVKKLVYIPVYNN